MDEVLERFESALSSIETTQEKSTFEGLYKYTGKYNQQEQRRKEILEIQKVNRNDKLDRFRGILDLVNAVDDNHLFQRDRVFYRPSIYVAGFHRASPTYSNVLMMSEWMVEKPQDFSENWFIVPCPSGVRMLVVANQGMTKCYTKFGHFRLEKRTALPGGNPTDPRNRSRCCVLDCFYYEKTNTMYVLDLLAWNNQPMTDGETEFRHYWLQTQLGEIPGLKVLSKRNQIIFKLLPKVPCTQESLDEFMSTYPHFENNTPPLDGLLFYHKRAHYFGGETPLVGWLFPFMVHEILGSDITVNGVYLAQKPAGYVNQTDYIEKFEAKMAKKKSRSRRSSTNSMDTDRSLDEAVAVVTKKPNPKKAVKNKDSKKDETMEAEETVVSKKPDQTEAANKKDSKNEETMEAEETQAEGNDDAVPPDHIQEPPKIDE